MHAAWFAELDRTQAGISSRLLAFLSECEDLQVSWTVKENLTVHMRAGNRQLAIFGIERAGDIEIPWSIAEEKKKFRRFAEILAGAIPDSFAYETRTMWRVRKAGGRVSVLDLLTAADAVRTALKELNAALRS